MIHHYNKSCGAKPWTDEQRAHYYAISVEKYREHMKNGDMHCTRCHKWKHESEFYVVHGECNECKSKRAKRKRAEKLGGAA